MKQNYAMDIGWLRVGEKSERKDDNDNFGDKREAWKFYGNGGRPILLLSRLRIHL